MAEPVEGYTFAKSRSGKWNRYFDGRVWLLKRGDDFDANETPVQIAKNIHMAARYAGFKLKSRLATDALHIQVVKIDPK